MPHSPEAAGAPVEEAWTLPARWYVDPEHHRREASAVMARTWQFVCRADEVAEEGAYTTAELAGEPLMVRGSGCAKALSCTYHGWTYALDGKLLAAPEMEGVAHFAHEDFSLRPVRC